MVVGRDFLLRMAAALLEEAELAADPQEAEEEEVTQHADDIITLAADLTAPDDLDSTPLYARLFLRGTYFGSTVKCASANAARFLPPSRRDPPTPAGSLPP